MILLLPLTFHQHFNKAQTWHTLCVFFLNLFLENHYLFIYLFLAALGLGCCLPAFSSCSEWGLLSNCGAQPSHYGGFSRAARALGLTGFSS